jgi:hypothetical protein
MPVKGAGPISSAEVLLISVPICWPSLVAPSIGEDRGFVVGARDCPVAKAGTEQVGVNAGVGVDEGPLGGESLDALAGDGIAVIEVVVLGGFGCLGVGFPLA